MDIIPPSDGPVVVQWLVDTRNLWPEATQTKQLATASRALAVLLTDDERASVLRYFHVRDAKMALASLLLKHLVVARCAGVCESAAGGGWAATQLTRDDRGKPVYRDAHGRQPVAFNVSHQAGLVVLAAAVWGRDRRLSPAAEDDRPSAGEFFEVGIDVVSPAERRVRDHEMVEEEGAQIARETREGGGGGGSGQRAESGWSRFVDMHADVFGQGEAPYLKYEVLTVAPASCMPTRPGDGQQQAQKPGQTRQPAFSLLDRKLRCFYTLWCLREAYVKMTGEALLAPWLGELEFRRFRPPPLPQTGREEDQKDTSDLQQDDRATITRHDIRFRGQAIEDVNLCLRALGEDFMVCTAVRTPKQPSVGLGLELGPFEELGMEAIVDFAERFGGGRGSTGGGHGRP